MTAYAELDRGRSERRILGSSFRYRRLVIANRVLLDPVELARPAMRAREIALLSEHLKRASLMLEFGAGGSTALALKLGVGKIVSVESDAAWIERIEADEAASRAIRDGRLSLLHADIGPTRSLGSPDPHASRQHWPAYARTPWPFIAADMLDLVLIDGRFRVACALETLLRCGSDTNIFIHDFWNRPAYRGLLPFLDVQARRDTMGLFTVKRDLDKGAAQTLLEKASFWPA